MKTFLFDRLMKAQALGDTSSLEFMRGRRILEINPDHPIIKDLNVSYSNSEVVSFSHGNVVIFITSALKSTSR